LQEALVAMLDALQRFRGESTVLHFACRVAVLTAMNARRRNSLRERTLLQDGDIEAGASPPAVERLEHREVILLLLDELPEPQAEVLALHCALGYTLSEIAAASGVPLNTVRGRLVTAKQFLRKQLLDQARLVDLEGGSE
jgi:RNA polymerase sigma factor (sigma-70 family)